jgi:uncharacterized membrane protein YadS
VGAAAAYGQESLAVATTVKLARALWIVPVALLLAFVFRSQDGKTRGRAAVPWFIFLFLGAAALRTYAPPWVFPSVFDAIINLAKAGMIVTLFLIGASLSRRSLKAVGSRPLLQGVLLWVVISLTALVAVINLS